MINELVQQYADYANQVKNNPTLGDTVKGTVLLQLAQGLNYLVPLAGQDQSLQQAQQMQQAQAQHEQQMAMAQQKHQADMQMAQEKHALEMQKAQDLHQSGLAQAQQKHELGLQISQAQAKSTKKD